MCDLPNKVQLDELKKRFLVELESFLEKSNPNKINTPHLWYELQVLQQKYPKYCNVFERIGEEFEEIHVPTSVKKGQIYMCFLYIDDVDILQNVFNVMIHTMQVEPMFS